MRLALKFEPVDWPPMPPPPPPLRCIERRAWFAETWDGLTLRVMAGRQNLSERQPHWFGWHASVSIVPVRQWQVKPCRRPNADEMDDVRKLFPSITLREETVADNLARHLMEVEP